MTHFSLVVVAGLAVSAYGENELLGGKSKTTMIGKIRETGTAKAYNISDPVYTCPKPGWVLTGEDCVFEDTIEPRYECPMGFEPSGHGGKPRICTRQSLPSLSCPVGTLIGDTCIVSEYTDPITRCPVDTHSEQGGSCHRLEPVQSREVCPDGSSRVGQQCLFVEYHEPIYVCPPDTVQEGRKCKTEMVYLKDKGSKLGYHQRRLDAVEGEDLAVAAEAEDEVLEGESFDEEEDGLFEAELQVPEMQGPRKRGVVAGGWLPATGPSYDTVYNHDGLYHNHDGLYHHDGSFIVNEGGKYHDKKIKPSPSYTETLKWQKIHVQVPVVVPNKNKGIKGKQQIVKVQHQAAERICTVGEKHGASCIVQRAVEPVIECPVPLINGQCARRVQVVPVTTCSVGNLVCPPKIGGTSCKCESTTEISPVPVCNIGTLEGDICLSVAEPREYCPLGYFFDRAACLCIRRDIEPALCLFSVTYVCPDCDFPAPPAAPLHHSYVVDSSKSIKLKAPKFKYGGRGTYLMEDENADVAY